MRPVSEFLFNKYWRIEVEGLENVPSQGPCLLVSNHSGMLPFDAWMIQFAVQELHPAGRFVRFLLEEWFTTLPFLSHNMARMGQVRGSQVNAERLLKRGELVGIFPEGVKGIEKPFRERYHLKRFGRGGTVRLAMKTGAPVLPVAVLGAEESYPVLFTSGFLANMLRMPYFPVTPTFPLLGPMGALPLPSKWRIRFGERVPLGDFSPGAWEDDILVNTLNEDVRQSIQEMLTDMVQHRRSLFFG
jgi:1-acyl-sn-glycerol-3-phosphate acyltransferase